MRRFVLILAVSSLLSGALIAGDLKQEDPAEQRLKVVAADLRCPVCQGESIYDSHSTVASQMKEVIREQIAAGKTDDQIRSFFAERYGEFILMEPDFHSRAWFVWAFPVLALLSGFAGLSLLLQRRKIQTPSVAASAVVADTADFIRRIEKLGP